jgi:hypothetical protein
MLTRVSIGVVFNAQRSILCSSTSARLNAGAPPCSYIRAGPKHPNITLPYNRVDTANACTNYTRTLLLNNPNNLV